MNEDFIKPKIVQKWGFGMAPIKPEVQATRIQSARTVKRFLESGIGEDVTVAEDLSVMKGLFSRSFRQDQWDWFRVWTQLGRPSGLRARSIADELLVLRRQVLDEAIESYEESQKLLWKFGVTYFLDLFISGHSAVHSADEGYGFIYVLSIRDAPTMLKIGFTNRNVEERVKEINSATGVVVPYGVRGLWIVKDAPTVERDIHAALADFRVRADREFFSLECDEAKSLITRLIRDRRISELA